tara:strand:+ start:84 stop:806 length:723 start_codon:yes stop_codon:yes gene_type:complete
MKNLIQITFFLLTLVGCSSLEITEVKTSETEANKILSMGLSHEENLIMANKVSDPDLILGVISRLKKAETQKNEALLEVETTNKYFEMIQVLGPDESGQTSYIGPSVTGSSNASLFNNQKDSYSYFLSGYKVKNVSFSHQLQISLEYISKNYRNYSSVYLCDKWRCDELTKVDLSILSTSANNCDSSSCIFTESFKFDLSDSDLNNSMNSGLFIQLNSENDTNKIQISSAYIKAYLKVIR